MKASEIKELSRDEVQQKLVEMKHELFNFRFQHGIGQLENHTKIKQTKKTIARLNTVLNDKARNPQDTDN